MSYKKTDNSTITPLFRPSLGTLSTKHGDTISSYITTCSYAEMIAHYASVHDKKKTFWSFTETNADGISHFKKYRNGVIDLDYFYGGCDNDFED